MTPAISDVVARLRDFAELESGHYVIDLTVLVDAADALEAFTVELRTAHQTIADLKAERQS